MKGYPAGDYSRWLRRQSRIVRRGAQGGTYLLMWNRFQGYVWHNVPDHLKGRALPDVRR